MTYRRKPISAPRLSGITLKALAAVAGSSLGGPLRSQLLKEAGLPVLLGTPAADTPLDPPLDPADTALPSATAVDSWDLAERCAETEGRGTGFAFETVADFARAYAEGTHSPVDVAERLIAAVAASEEGDRPLRVFIAHDPEDLRAQAVASAERHAAGKPLSVLDGIPVAVKDEVDMVPYPTTAGTTIHGKSPAAEDAETVRRLRAAGALLIGKANMHEIGIGVTGLNPHYGVCRNPYDPSRHTGGSSSGPGAAVAAGFGPFSLGADGGGSIRMPAALCGVVGLKATWGRISEHGAAPLCWSVGHLGPLAATARDTAAAYAVLAGEDARDQNTRGRPPVHLEGFGRTDLSGMILGVYRPWFEDADDEVVSTCDQMVERLKEAGAEVRDVEIPDLDVFKAAHLVLITSEMYAGQLEAWRDHRSEYGLDVQINLSIASAFPAGAYVHARRHRSRAVRLLSEVYAKVDGIVTPATGCVAPPIPESTLPAGDSNLPLLDKIMRFATLANLTGFPAITFPAGYSEDGLPVGLQVMGRPWEEAHLLRIAHVAEAFVERQKPAAWHSLLS